MLDYLLFALACFGHAYLLMLVVNVTYSQPYHKTFLKIFRIAIALLILGGPIAFVGFAGFEIETTVAGAFEHGQKLPLAIYLLVVLAMTCLLFPLVTVRRALRPPPKMLRSETTYTVDVAKELGAPPIGDGETAHVVRFPFNDIFRVDFTTLTIEFPNLPKAWDGLTLLQISDLHFLGTPAKSYYDHIMQRCMSDGVPDLLMITGDVIDTDEHIAWMEPVLGQLRWNVAAFAILGNHDWWKDFDGVRKELGRIGMKVVSNAWQQIDVRGEKLTVIGHEGPWFRQPDPDLSACPADGFRILLSHTPDNIRWAQRHNVSLMLSGHVHGGQVRVPLIGSIFVPSKFSRRFDMGTFFEPPTLLHVNRGLSGKEPLRFRCRPQVTRIVFKAAPR